MIDNSPVTPQQNDFVLSFQGVPAFNVLDSWQARLSEKIAAMEVKPHRTESPFHAFWRHLDLGGLGVNLITSPSQRVTHHPGLRGFGVSHNYDLIYMTKNAIRLHHCGREERVPEGSFVLIDNREPYFLEAGSDNSSIVLHFDDQWISRWMPRPESIVSKAFPGSAGWAAPLCTLLKVIAAEGLESLHVSRSVLGDQIGSLLSLVPGQDKDSVCNSVSRYLFRRVLQAVSDHAEDPEFCPEKAAAELGISKRHLHGICAREHTTFSRLLMECRLKRARERLDDKRYLGHRVCDIALTCGFSDPSHFARRFRQAYGVTPKSYRRCHQSQ